MYHLWIVIPKLGSVIRINHKSPIRFKCERVRFFTVKNLFFHIMKGGGNLKIHWGYTDLRMCPLVKYFHKLFSLLIVWRQSYNTIPYTKCSLYNVQNPTPTTKPINSLKKKRKVKNKKKWEKQERFKLTFLWLTNFISLNSL